MSGKKDKEKRKAVERGRIIDSYLEQHKYRRTKL